MTSDAPDYLPASLVAEMVFCPRNVWYRAVEQWEGTTTPALMKGRLEDEKRQNRPIIGLPERKQVRSVMVSSDAWGVLAIVDAVEATDGRIYPIEYKTRHIPTDDETTSFPVYGIRPEWAQVLLAAVLLEEREADPIPFGWVYYTGSRKRVKVLLTPERRTVLRRLVDDTRQLLQQGIPPEPIADARCPGCSYFSLCQPDLVAALHQKPHQVPRPHTVRDAFLRTVFVNKWDAQIRKDGLQLVVEEPLAGNPPGKIKIPLTHIHQLVLTEGVRISSEALRALRKTQTEVVFLSAFGRVQGRLTPELNKNIYLRLKQVSAAQDVAGSLRIGQRMIRGKLLNTRTLLMRYQRKRQTPALEKAIWQMEQHLKALPAATDTASVMGIEGAAAKVWFQALGSLVQPLQQDPSFRFESRSRRPPKDPINALLSFAYTLLLGDVQTACSLAGLDPYLGFLHGVRYGRPSLALDLMEEFRVPVADALVLGLINTGAIRHHHFEETWRGTLLTEAARKVFFQAWNDRRHETITHPLIGKPIPWFRIYEVQSRLLAKVISGDIAEYVPFLIR